MRKQMAILLSTITIIVLGVWVIYGYKMHIGFLNFLGDVSTGIILPLVAIVGLFQIKETKDNNKLTANRESANIASAQCERFATEIIQRHRDFTKKLSESGLNPYRGFVGEFTEQDFERMQYVDEQFREWLLRFYEVRPVDDIWLDHINGLEAFALYFVERIQGSSLYIGDPEIAFKRTGKTFCEMVVELYPIILMYQDNDGRKMYPAVIELFDRWSLRLLKEREAYQATLTQLDAR